MNKKLALVLCVGLSLGTANPADASLYGFTGPYDVSNWTTTTTTPTSGGSVDTSGAPTSITLTSPDTGSGNPANLYFSIFLTEVPVRFDWSFTSFDGGGPAFDPFGYLLNSTFFQLTNDSGTASQSGSVVVTANPGDIFGFYASSTDSQDGAAVTTVSNFAASVPEPGTLALLGLGWAGAMGVRRRKG